MSDKRPPYDRRHTKPLPREELAPIASSSPRLEDPPETRPALAEARTLAREAEEDIVTMVPCPSCLGSKTRPCASCARAGVVAPTRSKAIEREVECPLCCGGGRVAPEIASWFDDTVERDGEQA
jgi:hypothetical protein